MQLDDLKDALKRHNRKRLATGRDGEFCLSVSCKADEVAREIAVRAATPHPVVRISNIARIRDAGFTVEPSPRWDEKWHCDMFLEGRRHEMPTDEELEALRSVFYPPIPNEGLKRGE